MTKAIALAAGVAATLACGTLAARAGSVLQPGITVGTSPGSPKSEGLYISNTSDYGERTRSPGGLFVDLPVLTYATPFTFYETRLQFVFSQPLAESTGAASDHFFANSTLFSAQLARSIGDGLGVSYLAGIRAAEPDRSAFHEVSFEQRGAISYTKNGYDLTVNVINGIFGANRTAYPGWVNVDLTATKIFNRIEVGPVAFASSDTNAPYASYKRQAQFAVGGLVGYHFDKSLTLQVYVTRDVYIRNYPGYDTRGWFRFSLPLYQNPDPPKPLSARY